MRSKTERKMVDKRNRSLRSISIVTTIVFIAVVFAFNLIFENLLGEKLKWDWTGNKMYSIGDVTEEIVANLNTNVEIIGLFAEDSPTYNNYSDIIPMLKQYEEKAKGRISLSFTDPDIDPTLIKRIDPDNVLKPEAGSFVVYSPGTGKSKNLIQADLYQFEMDSYYQPVVTGIIAEQSVSGAIRYVISDQTPVVYFTTGHEELDYTAQYDTMVRMLRNNNYDVKTLELFNVKEIPEDCAVLAIVDPQKDLNQSEAKIVEDWLQTGGSLFVISSFNTADFTRLNQILEEYNLQLSKNKIRDENIDYQFQQDPYVMRVNAPAGLVSPETVERYTLAFNARGINELKNTKDWVQVEPVLVTSEQGVAEENGISSASSMQAVQNIGMLSENTGWINNTSVKEPARVLLLGSTELFHEDIIQAFGNTLYNYSLFYNCVNWLAGSNADESLMISPKIPASYAITKGSTTTNVFTAVAVMIIIPLALLLTALFVYRKRKHL